MTSGKMYAEEWARKEIDRWVKLAKARKNKDEIVNRIKSGLLPVSWQTDPQMQP